MDCRASELHYKEVINIRDGTRYGYVGDVELDTTSGEIKALVVYGQPRLFGLMGREEDIVFPWTSVKRFGEDIILVETGQVSKRQTLRGKEGGKISF